MFEDYLINEVAYHDLEVHFIKLFEAEMAKCGAKKEAFGYPYYNNYCADGTYLMDADPIFSAKSLVAGDVLRISICEEIAEYAVMHNVRGDNNELEELFLQ
jgi:hypothetical protein